MYYHECPVCHKFAFEFLNDEDICPVCGWSNNWYQEEYPNEDLLSNRLSLNEYRERYESLGVFEKGFPMPKEAYTGNGRFLI